MNVRKRGLALLMCICMIFTLLPFSAFADGTSKPDVVYGTYDNGPWTQDANAKDTVTHKTEGDNTLSLTKTAKRTADNTYDITLKVVSTQTETTTKPGSAATVLVMDVSGSMDICATCNNSEQHSDLLGDYWYEHSENCKIGKTRKVQDSETRLKAAKDAAYDFILSYSGAVLEDGQVTGLKDNAADGLGRYVSVVSFSTDSSVACEWMDVSTADGYNAVKAAIDGLKTGGGTNFEQGLSKAKSQLDNTTVKDIASKNVIALTDGEPTYWGTNDYGGGNGKKCSETVYTKTKAAATNLKKTGAKLYTICFGAANEKIKEYDDGKYIHGTITVGDFLKNKIATLAAGGKTYAYNATNTTELMKAFKAITSSITEGIKTGTVLDPMGDHITVTSKPDNFVETPTGYKWELSNPTVATDGGKTTYTYELTYTVTFDPNFGDFDENSYYAANKETTFTAGGKVYNFNVPGVKGTAPKYKVTYEYTGTVPTGAPELPTEASYKAGDTVNVAKAPTLDGYTFSGWSTSDATVEDGSFTMPSKEVKLTGSWTLRSDLSYTVHYYWNGTNDKVAKDKVVDGKTFGQTYTEEPIKIDDYTWVSPDSKSVTIETNTNEIIFYYYKNVTLTAEDRIVTYNGQEQTVNTGYDVVVKADNGKNFKLSGVEFRGVYASGTGKEVGKYDIDFVGKTVGKTDATAKYIVANTVKGTLTITPIDTVVVTIKGNTDSQVYNGAEQSVTGYTVVSISDTNYKDTDFSLKAGVEAKATGTNASDTAYPMGLTADSFVNNNSNFKNVTFVVEDGSLTITKRPLTIEGQSSEPITYDGQTHSFMDWWPVTATDNTGLVSGHEVSGISYLLTGKDAGSYGGKFTGTAKVMAGDIDVTGNYNIEYAPGEMLINRAEKIVIKITGNTATETYDGTEKSVTDYTTDVPDSSITVTLKEGKTAIASGTNVGKYMMGLEKEDFVVSNTNNYKEVAVIVEDGYLEITPITDEVVVTITGNKDTFTYDGKEHTVKGYETSISNPLYKATDFTFTGKAEVSRTEVGHSEMGLKADQFQNASDNFTNVKFVINDGSITIKERPYRPNPSITDKITVEITGNSDSVVYDGTEHSVKDYTVKISDSRYTEKDFTFSGKALASGVNAGTYEMGLKADQFKNTNARFKNVEFVIKADGVLTITQRPLTITAGSAEGIAPVTCDKYTVEGLATGDKVDSVKITGIQSEPGESPNVASDAVIKNAKGEDVTANYKITYVDGVLKAIEVLNKEIHFNYVIGYTDGTIRPNNDISRAEVATIFFRLLTDEAREQYTTTAGSFTDVKAGMWCNRAIATLTNMGIIKGYTDGSFQPNKSITRAELATIIARFAKLDVNTKTFSDINGHWAQKNIELAAGNGWINGYEDGTFRPNNNITRAETFAMINRVLDRQTESVSDLLPTSEMNMWSDNMDADAWYYKDVQEATNYHKCDRVGDSVYEKWTEKVPDIDWASYQI